ncbi:hypothetical protein WA026_005227 [Henosepilachna vigintioctopunctata]|uniref:C2H2-type domain-containing protein n=1 Tax=Henosepilachna vigintioctopunctata TaxID=420089 RepID=A0AAW1UP29_9CUCU
MTPCRFCFEEQPSNDCLSVNNDEIISMINVIYGDLISSVSNTSSTPVVCKTCMDLLRITYNFKVLCTTTESKLKNFTNCFGLETGNLDLVDVLQKEKAILISSNMIICRICLMEVTDNEFLCVNGKLVGAQYDIKEMLTTSLCDMNLSLTKTPILCKKCVETLIMSFTFYCKCVNSKSNVVNGDYSKHILPGHQNISSGFLQKYESDGKELIKLEKDTDQQEIYTENFNTERHIAEELDIDMANTNTNIPPMPEIIFIKQERDQESFSLTEEIKLEDNLEQMMQTNPVSIEEGKPYNPVTKYYFCKTCTYTTKRKACLIKHKMVHLPDYKREIFKCHECGYTVKRQKYLDRHMSLHAKGVDFKKHKCELCSFCTRKKSKLERHMTVHKDERETTMYKCSKCTFITKWKEYLSQHELTHNATEEEKKFKCVECNFSTNWRGSLIQHKVVHLSGEEALKFQCTECSFKTKRKDNLTKHMIRHMKDEDVRIFYCPECPFTSKYSSKLSRHLHVHKKGDELVVYNCTDCSFQTRWKNNLSQHMRVHQNPSDINLFKCSECSFSTKWKTCLTEHVVMHKTGEESKEFKCTECDFSTKWKKSLNMHQLTHNADDAIKKFKCDMCEYKTYRSHHLKRHMQVHSK